MLLIHNTTGTAKTWLTASPASCSAGQPLDAARHFLIIPDIIGFGRSSKPSDGLRARFPHYRLHDVAVAQHRLVTEGLNIPHLKLVMGLSLGGMLTWMFGGMFPDFMDALVPVASQPGPMSGRNWIQRRINVEAIRNDPEWNNGDYDKQPSTGSASRRSRRCSRRAWSHPGAQRDARAGRCALRRWSRTQKGDAKNRLYQIESTMDYDPSADLEKIKARLLAINFADDAVCLLAPGRACRSPAW